VGSISLSGSRRPDCGQTCLRTDFGKSEGQCTRVLERNLSGAGPKERAEFAARFADQGFALVKLYYETEWSDLLAIADLLPPQMRFAVDALWHLPVEDSITMAKELDHRDARWLECPLYPEDLIGHTKLAAAINTPIALGESYRMLREFTPFFRSQKCCNPILGEAVLRNPFGLQQRSLARSFLI